MGYYSGDYYRGDYYRGDPGIGHLLKRLVRIPLGAIGGGIRGGPVGGIIGGLGGSLSAIKSGITEETLKAGGGGVDIARLHAHHRAALKKHARMIAATTGQDAKSVEQALKRQTGMRRRPHMNPYNPRALRRAVRRARSFAKMALKVIRLTQPKRLKGRHFAGFKHRKRAA